MIWAKDGKAFVNPLDYFGKLIINPTDKQLIKIRISISR